MLELPCQGDSNKYPQSMFWSKNTNQRTNGPVNAHLSLLHIPINMFEYYGTVNSEIFARLLIREFTISELSASS